MKHLAYQFASRAIDYIFRPRNFATKALTVGGGIVVATFSVNWLIKFHYRHGGQDLAVEFATSDGLPFGFLVGGYAVGMLLIALAVADYVRTWRREARRLALIVELRGLHSSPDTPAKDANLGLAPGAKQTVLLDFRPRSEAERVDPHLALQRILTLKPTLELLAAGRDKSDVQVAVGGLAAVPALFLTGMLLDDESQVVLYDWQRDSKEWRPVEGFDDGVRTNPFDASTLAAHSSDVVLAVSLSYEVDLDMARAVFPGLPIVELRAHEVLADRYWSTHKQQAITAAFRDAVQRLMARGVMRIRLLLAAPASLCIRLGMAYDRRLMPDLLVYQYERTNLPPYPWAFRMPTHGQPEPQLVMTAAPAGSHPAHAGGSQLTE